MSDELKPGPWLSIHEELGVEPPEFDDRPIGAFVETYAESIPESSAIRFFERDITYLELNELANRLANAFVDLGVAQGDVVGLHMPNVPQYAIAVVAASKLGAVVTGISPLLAPTEVASQIEDAGVKVLMTLDTMASSTAQVGLPNCVKVVVVAGVDDLRTPASLNVPQIAGMRCLTYLDLTRDASADFEQADLPSDHVCLIQYTGGTTGKPKGAMLTVRGVSYHILIFQIYIPWVVGEETYASAFPLFHIGGLGGLLMALRFGGRSLLILDGRDMDHYCQQMIDCPPTRIAGVPTIYQMIADHPLSAQIDFSGLKAAMTGAAPITGEDRKRIERMLGGIVLSDGFGMTESGPTIVVNPAARCKPEAVGIPVPSVDVRIVDVETGTEEMPYGEAGEIIASSPALMKGYLNRPDETANALREWHGKTWMYTGDVGVMDDEGYVYIKDRAKDMIIVSGFKVFSVEVEDKLAALEEVALSALIGTPDKRRPGSEIVNLYVELTQDASDLDPDEVRKKILDFCRAEMAPYKVPKVIHFVDSIPLTPVGKIDKKVLRAQANAG